MSETVSRSPGIGFFAAAIAIGVEGALIIWMVPGFMALFAGQAHLTDSQLGYIASWEINAMAVTIGVSTFLLTRFDWRYLVGFGLLLICIGNFTTAFAHDYLLLLISRVIAGTGEGITVGLSFAALGRAENPDRMFAIYLVIGAVISSLLLLVLPDLQEAFGVAAVFGGNAVLCGLVAISLRWFADGRQPAGFTSTHDVPIHWRLAIGGLVGAFLYFLAQGETWSYVERIGQVHHVATSQIAWALAAANLSGVAGAALAGVLPRHWGRIWPLLVSGFVSIVSFQMLVVDISALGLIVAAVAMTFAWNVAQPLISGLCSEADREGRVVVAMGSIQTVGFGFGPALAASILYEQNFSPVIWSASALIAISLVVMFVGILTSQSVVPAVSLQENES
ncbi:MAG: MFS transporter [Alphaproteobacteria bacterium]|nr:MFS transporter [Alphaproteobacteria bacterium]MBU6472562.1 MFS transporter [Alphaproteobacteria bacterium]MDE2012649.1 MFS transporter [Alphaproteobacteria bacterium]MDE2072130.1 MFS transporter [Alphaproteobacteria bacterium]